MSELISKCCGAKMTKTSIWIQFGEEREEMEEYTCLGCNKICEVEAKEESKEGEK